MDRLTGSSQVKVQFIDFGNFEAKDTSELLCIPEDLATQPSAAFAVSIKTSYEDTKDNQSKIEDILSQDNLKVNMTGGCGTFYVNETEIVFGDESTEAESTNDVSMHLPKKPMEFSAAETPCLSTVEEVSESESPPNEAVFTPVNDSIVVEPPTPSAEATITVAPVTPTTPKLVPVSSFKRAIEAVKTQDDCSMSRTRRSSSSELPWTVGEVVTVRYDEVWRNATVTKMRGEMVEVNVDKCNAAPLWVEARHVRSACLPADALNLIDKDINYNSVRENGDGADLTVDHSVAIGVGKVQDWIRKNQQTVPDKLVIKSPVKKNLPNSLPTGPALLDYCKSTAGSHHVQSILSSSDRDFSLQILQTLIKSPNTMSILTGASSSFVIQKLVSVLPSSDLAPLHNILASNFIRLSLDKFGCRLVQFYLEYCSEEQQILIANQICCQSTIKALACDSNGTFVAQSCLPHLMKYPDQVQALVQAVLGCTVELGSHHHGTYFMQCLVTSLAGQQVTSVCQQMLYEDIMSNMSVLAVTEPGSR